VITTLLNYLKSLKLSLTQWLVVSTAAAFAALLALLKLKDRQIEKLEIKNTTQKFDGEIQTADEKTAAARAKLQEALKDFTDNGGKL
jgi:thioredoxin-like negative regulator of GroEL